MTSPYEPTTIRWNRILPWVLFAAVFGALLYGLGDILAPFMLGAGFAYLFDPMVSALQKRGLPRAWGSLLAVALLGMVAMLLVLAVVPLVWREAQLLITRLPDAIDAIQDRFLPWLSQHLGITLQLDAETLRTWVAEHWSKAGGILGTLASHAGSGGSVAISVLVNLLLVPVVMFYFLVDWPRFLHYCEKLIPRPWHDNAMRMLQEIDAVLAEFLRGQLTVMLALAVFYSVGLWIAGVSFPLPVGILTGFLVFIPYVGYGLGLLLAILVATLQFQGLPPLIGVAVVYSLGQVVESFFLTPRLVGKRIGLHPLAVIFAVMAFGQLFGFTGVLVALPVCASGAVAIRELSARYFASPLYLGDKTATPRYKGEIE